MLKFSEVKPLFKKGDMPNLSKCRPISLLPSFSKFFRKSYIYIILYYILAKESYGFKTNSSTEIATHTLINNILSSLNNNLCAGGLFCNLKRH